MDGRIVTPSTNRLEDSLDPAEEAERLKRRPSNGSLWSLRQLGRSGFVKDVNKQCPSFNYERYYFTPSDEFLPYVEYLESRNNQIPEHRVKSSVERFVAAVTERLDNLLLDKDGTALLYAAYYAPWNETPMSPPTTPPLWIDPDARNSLQGKAEDQNGEGEGKPIDFIPEQTLSAGASGAEQKDRGSSVERCREETPRSRGAEYGSINPASPPPQSSPHPHSNPQSSRVAPVTYDEAAESVSSHLGQTLTPSISDGQPSPKATLNAGEKKSRSGKEIIGVEASLTNHNLRVYTQPNAKRFRHRMGAPRLREPKGPSKVGRKGSREWRTR